MKKLWLFLMLLSCTSLKAKDPELEMTPVPYLDPVLYQGEWFEIASIPASFQRDCFRDVRAVYTFDQEKERIEVLNRCQKENGREKKAEGLARVNPKLEFNSQLQVTFVKIFGRPIWAFGGDYWVLSLDSQYQVSLVGEPKRKFSWILSRTPSLSDAVLTELHATLLENDYDPCQLIMSRTIEQDFTGEKPDLCTYLDLDE